MNPEAKNTMRHKEMLGRSSNVTFKEINTRSRFKQGEDGLIDLEESSKLFGNHNEEVNNSMDVDVGSKENSESVKVKMVSNHSFESNVVNSKSNNDCLDGSSGIKSNGIEVMLEMPIPMDKNHILNPNFGSNSKPISPTRVSFGEVKRPGEESRINDMNASDKVNDFGREVAEMDPVIKDGSAMWNMTVIGHFVRYRMSYKEIIGNLRRMWRPYQFDDIIMYNSGLYFCKFKSHEGMQTVIENGPWASFARVLVGVDSTKGLVDAVKAWYRNLGKSMILDVEYAWRLLVCKHCKIFGHNLKSYSAKDLIKEEKAIKKTMKPVTIDAAKTNSNDGWKSVGYIRNGYARGGFSNNGRCSFGSNRGGHMNNGGRGNGISRQYVPVKNYERNAVDKEKGLRETKMDQGNNDSTDKINVDSVVENVSMSRNNSKKVKTGDDLSSKNRFSMCDEEDSKDIIKWRKFCTRVDIMCDIGIVAEEEEKVSWTDTMLEYYLDKWKNKGVKDNASKAADKRVANECAEEMIEYYEGVCEDIRSDKINGHFDDVVGGFNVTACFLASDEVFNLYEESMAEMQGGKKLINLVCNDLFGSSSWVSNTVDSRKGSRIKLFVSLIYADNGVKDRRTLWKNLTDHKTFIDSSPLVLLGDFNVLLPFDESSNYFNTRDKGMMDFKEGVQDLEIQDINSYGMFYTWIEKRKNHNLDILKKLDRVIGNGNFINIFEKSYANFLPYMTSDHCPVILAFPERLKNMKLHMRRLNKRNGNVFEKEIFLKTELEIVQKILDKDPYNSLLREEETVYCMAYTDAVLDEEKLLKQKTKIEWLRERDRNTAYFHKVLKGRFSKSRIEVVTDDTGNTFYGDDIPAKPVLDEEIKAVMFDIKDDNAAGPDGCTLKFFKKAWLLWVLTLKEGLDRLVDYNQCAFIPDRHISDNILLTQDLMVGFFKSSRGLRQVDLISPYLFTLVMKVLNLMIKRQIGNDKRFKFHSGCKALGLTHLCFADDLLLLCHGDLISACVLRRGLDEFSMCSGLYPSMEKSTSYLCNVPNDIKVQISLGMTFKESTLPIRYLGVPMMTRKLRNDDCWVLINNLKKKIFDWKNKYLSYAGKLHLIASVLSSLNVYWASMFVLPKNICTSIDRILKDFLWSFKESRKGFTSVAWKDICVPKSQGGLGLRSMKLMNEGLMIKYLWNIIRGLDLSPYVLQL
nr:RNA-directed DNA polymerase, eukaryota, reverse transcriptase zinc-binding domain protein [Tanacetum cinerariifolium]